MARAAGDNAAMEPTDEQARMIARLRELAAQGGPRGTLAVEDVVQAYFAQLDQLLDTGWARRLEPEAELQCEDVFGFLSMDDAWRYEAVVRGPFVGPPCPTPVLLRVEIADQDPLLMDVAAIGRQRYRGCVVRRYGPDRFAGPGGYPEVFELVGASSVYNNRTLEDGERAIVLVSQLGGPARYYQGHRRSHWSVRAVDGIEHLVMQDDLTGCRWEPADLRAAAFHVAPGGPGLSGTYLPLARVEEHLRAELARIADGRSN